MKKVVAILVLILLTGCGTATDQEDPSDYVGQVDSSVLDTDEEMVLYLKGEVKDISGNQILMDAEDIGLVWVTIEDGIKDTVTISSIVEVAYNGTILESYPAQATGTKLTIIEKGERTAYYDKDSLEESIRQAYEKVVLSWNEQETLVAYVVEDTDTLDDYNVFVGSLFEEEAVMVAHITYEQPSLNWFYDFLEIELSEGSYEVGPDYFNEAEVLIIEGLQEDVNRTNYELEKNVYTEENKAISIEYYQVSSMTGELVKDYLNQSLMEIVSLFSGYDMTVDIQADILEESRFITIAYNGIVGDNNINRYITLDSKTATEVTIQTIVTDWDGFELFFKDATGYEYRELEGVWVYIYDNIIVFTFVPLDDQAERVYFDISMQELEPYISLDFDMPPS